MYVHYLTALHAVNVEVTLSLSRSEPVTAGDLVIIMCTARINMTTVDIDINVAVNLTLENQLDQQNSIMTNLDDTTPGLYVRSVFYSNISAQNSGLYVCNASVSPSEISSFLSPHHDSDTFNLTLGK